MGNLKKCFRLLKKKKKTQTLVARLLLFTLEAVVFNTQNKSPESYSSAAKAFRRTCQPGIYRWGWANRMTGLFFSRKWNADSAQLFISRHWKLLWIQKIYFRSTSAKFPLPLPTLSGNRRRRPWNTKKQAVRAAYLSKDTLAISQSLSNLATVYGRVYDETEDKIYLDSSANGSHGSRSIY